MATRVNAAKAPVLAAVAASSLAGRGSVGQAAASARAQAPAQPREAAAVLGDAALQGDNSWLKGLHMVRMLFLSPSS